MFTRARSLAVLLALGLVAAALARPGASVWNTGAAAGANCSVFPPDNPWNTDVSAFPVHPQSDG